MARNIHTREKKLIEKIFLRFLKSIICSSEKVKNKEYELRDSSLMEYEVV